MWHLRQGASGASFVAAGDALTLLLGTRCSRPLPDWSLQLANAAVGSLLRVQDMTMDQAEPLERIQLSRAAAILSILCPRASAGCDAAISTWMGWDTMPVEATEGNGNVVPTQALLAMFLNDLEQARDCVSLLLDDESNGVGLVLHDWVIARLQGHGQARDAQCFHHFWLSLRRPERHAADPGLMVLAALVHHTCCSPNRQNLLPWMAEIGVGSEVDPVIHQVPTERICLGRGN